MNELNMTLVKNIENKVNDCSSASQLRSVFNIYKVYLYNEDIKERFDGRIEYLKHQNTDPFTANILENFIEDYEDEIDRQRQCVAGPKKNKLGRRGHEPLKARSSLNVELNLLSKEGRIYKDVLKETIKMCLDKSMGNKSEAARMMGVSKDKFKSIMNKSKELKRHYKYVREQVKKMTRYEDI